MNRRDFLRTLILAPSASYLQQLTDRLSPLSSPAVVAKNLEIEFERSDGVLVDITEDLYHLPKFSMEYFDFDKADWQLLPPGI